MRTEHKMVSPRQSVSEGLTQGRSRDYLLEHEKSCTAVTIRLAPTQPSALTLKRFSVIGSNRKTARFVSVEGRLPGTLVEIFVDDQKATNTSWLMQTSPMVLPWFVPPAIDDGAAELKRM